MSTDQHAQNFLVPVYISWTRYTKANYPFLAAPARAGSIPHGRDKEEGVTEGDQPPRLIAITGLCYTATNQPYGTFP